MTSQNNKVDTDSAEAPVQGVGCGALVRRLGRFAINRMILVRQPERLRPLFAEMIVVEAQVRWEHDRVEYLAMSDRFEPIPEYISAPLYDITFRFDDDGRVIMHEVNKSNFA